MATIIIVLAIHFWFVMKNNALNLSNFYKEGVHVNNKEIRFYLLISIMLVFMGSFMINAFTKGPEFGWLVFKSQYGSYGFFVLYIAMSFSRFKLVRGYLGSLTVPKKFLIPRTLQNSLKFSDRVELFNVRQSVGEMKSTQFTQMLPIKGVVRSELVFGGETDMFLIKLERDLL